jgi:glycosyltransferase involved in cell wall biosynthesis
MLRAAAMLLRRHSQLRFLLVGDGSELPKYRELAGELGIETAVTFTGLLSNPTGAGVFEASDIYCQPSIWQEACPLAVLEAMSFKLPVIASDTGGMPELVADGRSGILVPVGDSEAICAALERLLIDADLRQSMGEAGYRLILEGIGSRRQHVNTWACLSAKAASKSRLRSLLRAWLAQCSGKGPCRHRPWLAG